MAPKARSQDWQPKHLATALDELRAHVNTCPVCRTWKATYSRNPQCDNQRLITNKVIHLWSQVPAGSKHRQLTLFAEFQDESEVKPPPF